MTARTTPKASTNIQDTISPQTDPACPPTPQVDAGTIKQENKPSAVAPKKPAQLGTDAVITNAMTKNQKPAITSEKWHVVHSEWSAKRAGYPPFARRITSEHATEAAAVVAAKRLAAKLRPAMNDRPIENQDQVLVRPPRFRTLKYKSFTKPSGSG
jgi:hypothetical protein